MILAGIDIGTNSIRLLIAEIGPGSFREQYTDRKTTRLGKNLDSSGRLSDASMERSLVALLEFSTQINKFPVQQVSVVGTSALRNAANAQDFINAANERTGLDITIISGEDEARLMLRGVGHALRSGGRNVPDPLASALVIDIGGGSTECIVTSPAQRPVVKSLPLGAVYLAESCGISDPPEPGEVAKMREVIRRELVKAEQNGLFMPDDQELRPRRLIGTAGTITTLVAMDHNLAIYDPAQINSSTLTRAAVDTIVAKLMNATLKERRGMTGLESGREDIILPGAVVTQEIMERYKFSTMQVSDGGLREGIVLNLYERMSHWAMK